MIDTSLMKNKLFSHYNDLTSQISIRRPAVRADTFSRTFVVSALNFCSNCSKFEIKLKGCCMNSVCVCGFVIGFGELCRQQSVQWLSINLNRIELRIGSEACRIQKCLCVFPIVCFIYVPDAKPIRKLDHKAAKTNGMNE